MLINIIFESNDFAVCWRYWVRFPAGATGFSHLHYFRTGPRAQPAGF